MIVSKDLPKSNIIGSDECVIESYSSNADVPLLANQREESCACNLVSKSPLAEIGNRAKTRSIPTSPVTD